MNLIIQILNKMGIKATKENLTFLHMKAFLQAKWRRFLLGKTFRRIVGEGNIEEYIGFPKHKKEQVIYRISILEDHPMGSQCLKKNECPCQCTTSEVLLSDPACDQECFKDMMSKDDWEFFKRVNGIKIDLFHNKVIQYAND